MNASVVEVDEIVLKEVIQSLSEKLMAYYVFPDIAKEICTNLQKHLEDGTYSDITEGEFLAFALTTHIQEVNQDRHLQVRWYAEPLPVHEGSMLNNKEKVEQLKQKAKLENYGIYKVERLPGNAGYIDIRYFYRTSWGSSETIVAAMGFLANMNAVIVDLRNCEGGNPGTVALICSYFFEGEPVHLNSLYWRENDITEQYWTLPYVPGRRIVDQPVYILISKDTFSGGEEFSYNLQALRRATLIGEATAGGAHPGSPYRIHTHFEVFIPNGRTINPVTGQNWEGIGVQPDVSVASDKALKVAHDMALKSIIKNANGPSSHEYPDFLLEEIHAALLNAEEA